MAWRFRSISTYFVIAAAGSASVTFLLLIALVIYQLESSIERQKVELEQISDTRLAAELDAQVRLAAARLQVLFSDTSRRISAVAGRSDTLAAIASRNVVAMSELFEPAARYADVDVVVAVDADGNVIGASTVNTNLVTIGQTLKAAPFFDRIVPLLERNSRSEPEIYSQIVVASRFAGFLPDAVSGAASHVVFVPLFDDFGDIAGGLIAQRWLRSTEATLGELAEIGSVSFTVSVGDEVVSAAAIDPGIEVAGKHKHRTNFTADGAYIARCGTPFEPFEICALKPVQELYSTQNELTRIGREEGQSLIRSLALFGFVSSVLLIVSAILVSRRITRPLLRITDSVSKIAAGNYEDDVEGTERADEVGNIARAVVVLQASARERDSLRANIEVKNVALKSQEAALREQNTLFDAALNNMSHGLCMFDRDRRLIVCNRRYLELFGLSGDQATPGVSWEEFIGAQDIETADGDHPLDGEGPHRRRSSATYRLRSGRCIHMTRQPLLEGGWVAIFDDVTEREQARSRLVHLANHDALTSLPNRIRLREHLERVVARREAEGGAFGVLCIDLDEFKTVNDSLGHPVGDDLLRKVGDRLLQITEDGELVARMGGDEFAIVTDLPVTEAQLSELAAAVIEGISAPYQLEQHEVAIGASIGIAIARDDTTDADELLKQGDMALYQAKSDGRNTFRFFEMEMELNVHRRRNLTTDLRRAVARGELQAYFQPQISLQTGEINGFEALMRWQHPERGLISPAEFIPIAEETGLIVPMGEWMLREACRIAAAWPAGIRLAVNISARQLQNRGFTSTLLHTLATTAMSPNRLELEITESVLLSDDDDTRRTLLRLKDIGVKISMDDFGTGYSSLSCLRSFPFDKIKIDQSFIRTMADSQDSVSIVRAIIDLAQSLKITTTAEGVESAELVAMLRETGCTEAQGYYFGRPAPAETARDLIRNAGHWPRVAVAG